MRAASAGRGRARAGRLPRLWLLTDERLGGLDEARAAVAALPAGAGVVLRHRSWPEAARAALLGALAPVCRRRRLLLLVAHPWPGARADGVHLSGGRHLPRRRRFGLVTAPAHDARSLREACAAGADLLFLSPVFPTASHPGARALGPLRFGLAVRGVSRPVVALGGMDRRRARRLAALGAYGFAAVSALRAASPSSTMLTSAESSKAASISPARAITSRADGTM